MKRSIIFVHGFNDGDEGADNIDLLAPYARKKGYDAKTQAMDYGWRGLFGVRFKNRETAQKLIDLYNPGDVVVGYSNGCDIVALAIEMGLPVEHCIFIHPALRSDWEPPPNSKIKRIDVYYSENDKATRAAQLIHKYSPLNLLLGRHHWGNMGTVGPTSLSLLLVGHDDGCDHHEWVHKKPELYLSMVEPA